MELQRTIIRQGRRTLLAGVRAPFRSRSLMGLHPHHGKCKTNPPTSKTISTPYAITAYKHRSVQICSSSSSALSHTPIHENKPNSITTICQISTCETHFDHAMPSTLILVLTSRTYLNAVLSPAKPPKLPPPREVFPLQRALILPVEPAVTRRHGSGTFWSVRIWSWPARPPMVTVRPSTNWSTATQTGSSEPPSR